LKMLNRPKPLVLLILDGFGYSLEKEYNAMDIPQSVEMTGRSLLAAH